MNTELVDPKVAKAYQRAMEKIQRSAKLSFEAGVHLLKIRDEKLYEAEGFRTFDAWVSMRSPYSRTHVYRLMGSASEVARIEYQCSSVPQPLLQRPELSRKCKALPDAMLSAVMERIETSQDKSSSKIEKIIKSAINESKQQSKGKKKASKATADLQESYRDDIGNEVPESLWPVWREVAEITGLSAQLNEMSGKLADIATVIDSIGIAELSNQLRHVADDLLDETPTRVEDGDWLPRRDVVG